MRRVLELETREPEVFPEEPIHGNYDIAEEEFVLPEDYQGKKAVSRYELEHRLPRRRVESPKPVLVEPEVETAEEPSPFREKSATPVPSGLGLKLKAGERVVKRWTRSVWFMRMSDVKNVIGHDVHLTRLRSGVYAFRGVDDETMENLCRIIGKRMPRESDTFGPLKIKSKGKKSKGVSSL